MIVPKNRESSEAGYQPKTTPVEPDNIKGYQPKVKPAEEQLNPPSGGSNVVQPDSQEETDES